MSGEPEGYQWIPSNLYVNSLHARYLVWLRDTGDFRFIVKGRVVHTLTVRRYIRLLRRYGVISAEPGHDIFTDEGWAYIAEHGDRIREYWKHRAPRWVRMTAEKRAEFGAQHNKRKERVIA